MLTRTPQGAGVSTPFPPYAASSGVAGVTLRHQLQYLHHPALRSVDHVSCSSDPVRHPLRGRMAGRPDAS